ncbi:MAG: phosphotransferase family protein [Sphingomicrobium sp.]
MKDANIVPDWRAQIDPIQLEAWMDRCALEHGPIERAQVLSGGTQNILLHFERGGRGFVLRRPPMHPRPESNDTMRREMQVLAALAGTDVPHPGLIASCPETDVLGTSFYLMEPIDGFNPAVGLPQAYRANPQWRRRMGFALVEGIACLGAVDPAAIGLGDFGRPEGFLERQVPRWRAQFETYSSVAGWPGEGALAGIERVGDWLERHCTKVFQPGLMHGDYHFANVMFRHDAPELAAIVDWELATNGDPLIDLGWLLATWPGDDGQPGPVEISPWDGFPTADELVGHYRERSSRDLSAIDWYKVMGCYKLAILLEGTHARAHDGAARKEVGAKLHHDAIRLIERALKVI